MAKRENHKLTQRSLVDRRGGNDRRTSLCTKCGNMERRKSSERRMVMEEKRFGWIRDTKWSSIYLEVLRYHS